jgi:hypothetical protein
VHVRLAASRVTNGFNLVKGGVDGTAAHFSLAFGGGIDANVNKVLAVRLFQADYESIRVPNPITGDQQARNNFRLSFGIVFKIK